ncbi:type I-E CRISPR-associated protein Cse1/CasA [Pararhodospirillum photometricum]|uniref:CRISPR-associated protein, Cse1 family n=1 Tax=Pararhodospirillum photometricum DSM 122 TaxID=1150469 RepID=H6SKX5_PARPM|nr:type I-E CRISPR-associated protein Cse1/CasA [Pararhodospirillum photometricum]CCG08640.1 CRISPR-associated protein, Cse1 family [Pararhodospirillum photometricum DSM 122]
MPFSLLDNPWIPVRRASGKHELIRPDQITEGIESDPVVDVAAPRPDVSAALREMLVGLFTTTRAPETEADWEETYRHPPSPEMVREALAPLAPVMQLDGEGPRFFQDQEALAGEALGVEALFIDAPGEETIKNNKDLFVKRGKITVLSRPAAAWALVTLQTYAPSGGAGHMTSLRGGGPLTTMLLPPATPTTDTLWHRVWLSVESAAQLEARRVGQPDGGIETIFPWAGPTRVSGKGGGRTTQAQVDPLHVYWGMPRRLRLLFRPAVPGEVCDLTGLADPVMVEGFIMRPYGFQYGEGGFQHPLSPYYRLKPGAPWLPVHGGPSGVGYRDWLALVTGDTALAERSLRRPAQAVSTARDRLRRLGVRTGARLSAAGFDMDNMKARGWVDAQMPLLVGETEEAQQNQDTQARLLVAGAGVVAGAVGYAVKMALFDAPKDARGDFSALQDRLWADTEPAFLQALEVINRPSPSPEVARQAFLRVLERAALAIFDANAPVEGVEHGAFRRVVQARGWLTGHFVPATKTGKTLYAALGLALPQAATSKGKSKRKPAA